jgi:hypothetical protein
MNKLVFLPVLASFLACKPTPPDAAPPPESPPTNPEIVPTGPGTVPLVVDPVRLASEPVPSTLESVPGGSSWNGVPIPGGFASLCSGRVYGMPGAEIHWENFTSTASVGETIAFYREKLGPAESETDTAATWRLTGPDRVLHVGDSFRRPDESCPRLPEGTKAVLEVSQMLKH